MFKFLEQQKNTVDFAYPRQYKAKFIKDIVLCVWILSLSLVVNFFHFPLYTASGIEIERFEFGLIVPFVLIKLVSLKILLGVVFLLPFLDQLFHGHNVLLVPFEAVFNLVSLIFVAGLTKVFLVRKKNVWKLSFFSISLIFFVIFKFFYFISVIYIFFPQLNFFTIFTNNHQSTWFIFSFLAIPIIFSTVRFFIILFIMTFLNKW